MLYHARCDYFCVCKSGQNLKSRLKPNRVNKDQTGPCWHRLSCTAHPQFPELVSTVLWQVYWVGKITRCFKSQSWGFCFVFVYFSLWDWFQPMMKSLKHKERKIGLKIITSMIYGLLLPKRRTTKERRSQAKPSNPPYTHSRLLTLTLLLIACRFKSSFLINQCHW